MENGRWRDKVIGNREQENINDKTGFGALEPWYIMGDRPEVSAQKPAGVLCEHSDFQK